LKPIDNVGANSATNVIARFKDDYRKTMLLNFAGG
jgi:hypothetical protein